MCTLVSENGRQFAGAVHFCRLVAHTNVGPEGGTEGGERRGFPVASIYILAPGPQKSGLPLRTTLDYDVRRKKKKKAKTVSPRDLSFLGPGENAH